MHNISATTLFAQYSATITPPNTPPPAYALTCPVLPSYTSIFLDPPLASTPPPSTAKSKRNKAKAKSKRNKEKASSEGNTSECPNKLPRPLNSFFVFRKERTPFFKGIPATMSSKKIASEWKEMGQQRRQWYKQLADEAEREFILKNPDYKFQPRKRGTGKIAKTKKAEKAEKAAGLANIRGDRAHVSLHQVCSILPQRSRNHRQTPRAPMQPVPRPPGPVGPPSLFFSPLLNPSWPATGLNQIAAPVKSVKTEEETQLVPIKMISEDSNLVLALKDESQVATSSQILRKAYQDAAAASVASAAAMITMYTHHCQEDTTFYQSPIFTSLYEMDTFEPECLAGNEVEWTNVVGLGPPQSSLQQQQQTSSRVQEFQAAFIGSWSSYPSQTSTLSYAANQSSLVTPLPTPLSTPKELIKTEIMTSFPFMTTIQNSGAPFASPALSVY
ncbi:hypothetical protein BGW38_000952 [Lunasporangiospora selenospora]|uniref:HMG box domain-containing protein n=1 Tax=Lunasporangiospora selenospora TaxID=979761 RepID=A0A9P6FUV9_9FUNG|nr:hypothetical protein BGW38_000952 [Lunasporangiospora selenospora]